MWGLDWQSSIEVGIPRVRARSSSSNEKEWNVRVELS